MAVDTFCLLLVRLGGAVLALCWIEGAGQLSGDNGRGACGLTGHGTVLCYVNNIYCRRRAYALC